MRILVNGISGFMGREVAALALQGYRSSELAFGVDLEDGEYSGVPVVSGFDAVPMSVEVDCIVDFSHHSATPRLLDFAVSREIPVVVATTGHTEDELAAISRAAEEIPVFHSANMSLGVALLVELAKTVAQAMPEADIEIVEKHHTRKLDAPSGTALMIAEAVREVRQGATLNIGRSGHGKRDASEIGIHALRLGNVVGEHEVILATPSQTLTLKHEAHNRALFAEGALAAAAFIVGADPGLYDMKSLVGDTAKEGATTVV